MNGQRDVSIVGRADTMFMEVSALLRQKEKQQRANRQTFPLSVLHMRQTDPARALDKKKKTSG